MMMKAWYLKQGMIADVLAKNWNKRFLIVNQEPYT
jgi:hypothetical protein